MRTTSAIPNAPWDKIAGTWKGTYACSGTNYDVTFRFGARAGRERLARMNYVIVSKYKRGQTGALSFYIAHDEDREFTFEPRRWIRGRGKTYPISGKFNRDWTKFNGRTRGYCYRVALERVDGDYGIDYRSRMAAKRKAKDRWIKAAANLTGNWHGVAACRRATQAVRLQVDTF